MTYKFIHSCPSVLQQDLDRKVVTMVYLDWKEGLMQMKGHAEEKQGSKITKECI